MEGLWVTDCVMDGARSARLRSSVVEHDWRRLRADGSRNEREIRKLAATYMNNSERRPTFGVRHSSAEECRVSDAAAHAAT